MKFWIPKDTAAEKEKKDHVPYLTWARQGLITLTDGNVIDYGFVKQELLNLLADYNIRELAFDRWGAAKLIQELVDSGAFTMDPKKEPMKCAIVPFGQGYASMSSPTKELMNMVLAKKIHHGGNPVLRWNVDNLVVTQDPAGNLKPDKAKATQKIDGCVALIMAIDRTARHTEGGPSIYETQGVKSF
jgi:phage terminase large subunit-like protein